MIKEACTDTSEVYKIDSFRTNEITHLKGKCSKSDQVRQPRRNKVLNNILTKRLTPHEVAIESYNKLVLRKLICNLNVRYSC